VKCSRDVKICTDVLFRDAQEKSYDVVVLPGGLGGAKTFTSVSLTVSDFIMM